MQAVISGQAGVALLVEGDRLSSIHAGKTDEVVRRRNREIPYLFGDARDFQFLEDVELPEVARELELATTKADALHVALILLDPQLTHDTRREAAEELTELSEIKGVLEYVEAVLYSRPMPGDGDLPGALLCCAGRSEPARQLLLRLGSLQGPIAVVFGAWEQIPDRLFGSEQDRRYALAMVVRAGLFRDFVETLATQGDVGEFLERTLRGSSLVAIQNHREILERWASPLQSQGYPSKRWDAWAALRDEVTVGSRHPKRVEPLRILYVHCRDSGEDSTVGDYPGLTSVHSSMTGMAMALRRVKGIELATHNLTTLETLKETLRSDDYQVVHFAGHGRLNEERELPQRASVDGPARSIKGAGFVIKLESVDGAVRSIRGADLVIILRDLQNLRLVFIDACFSGQLKQDGHFEPVQRVANQLVQSGVPYVVALQGYVEDQVAFAFSQMFYTTLVDGRSISDAMAVSYRVLSQDLTRLGWAMPVLYQRAVKRDVALDAWRGKQQLGPLRRLYRRFRRFWRHRT